jgi:predicted dehydrogenase
MEKIRVAIAGLGRIAGLLEDDRLREKPCTHAGAVSANPDCVLAAGCDTDEERRVLFSRRWARGGAPLPVYAEGAEMIARHRPDILIIATPPDSHAAYCALAVKEEVPVVVCEKPLADTLRDARRIAALERRGGTRIMVNHERRYAKDYRRAAEILRSGGLGRLLSVQGGLCMGRTRKLETVLWHDGTHLADALMFLSGMIMEHKKTWGAALDAGEGTAWLLGLLRPPEGGKGAAPEGRLSLPFVVELGAGRDHLIFELEFSCERGRLRIGNGIFEVWESGPSPYAEKFNSLKKTPETFTGKTGYFARMIEDAAACAGDKTRKPVSGAADGLRVVEYLNSVCPLRERL